MVFLSLPVRCITATQLFLQKMGNLLSSFSFAKSTENPAAQCHSLTNDRVFKTRNEPTIITIDSSKLEGRIYIYWSSSRTRRAKEDRRWSARHSGGAIFETMACLMSLPCQKNSVKIAVAIWGIEHPDKTWPLQQPLHSQELSTDECSTPLMDWWSGVFWLR